MFWYIFSIIIFPQSQYVCSNLLVYLLPMAKIKISDIKHDKRNTNKHTEFGMHTLDRSLEQVGIIEGITISNDNVIISGCSNIKSTAFMYVYERSEKTRYLDANKQNDRSI